MVNQGLVSSVNLPADKNGSLIRHLPAPVESIKPTETWDENKIDRSGHFPIS